MFGARLLPRTVAAALRDVDSAQLPIRLAALSDLVRHAREGSSEAVQALRRACLDTGDDVRAKAAVGLADAEVRQALPDVLLLAEHDPSPRVRQMALLAVGELGDASQGAALDVLRSACASDEPSQRFQALLALHQLSPAGAEPHIVEATLDSDPEVRRLAFRIAEAQWAERELPELVRSRARSALTDSRLAVRIGAGLLLMHFGDPAGEGVVLDLVAGRLPGATLEDQQAGVELAGRFRLRAASEDLARRAFSLLRRDPLNYEARVALARLGDDRARREIIDGLSAWTFDMRTLAVAAAGRTGLSEARGAIERFVGNPGRAEPAAVAEALRLLDAERTSE